MDAKPHEREGVMFPLPRHDTVRFPGVDGCGLCAAVSRIEALTAEADALRVERDALERENYEQNERMIAMMEEMGR